MKVIKQVLGAMIIASQIRETGVHEKYSKWKGNTDSAQLQKIDYTLGDNAETLEEYKDSVSEDYECIGNEKANTMSSLWGPVIMLYGENHLHQKLPGLRGDFGALLLESRDPELCRLGKYGENSKNVCVHIEEDAKHIHTKLDVGLTKLKQKIEELIELIELGAVERIKSEAKPLEKELMESNIWHYIDKLKKFGKKNFHKIHLSSTPEKRIALKKAVDAYSKQKEKFIELNLASINSRDKLMVAKSADTIERLGPESAATIIVGDAHIPDVSKGILRKFPQRPIVVCRPEVERKIRAEKVSVWI